MNYVKNMEIMTANAVIWATLVLAALTTTCGMIFAGPMVLVETPIKSGKRQIVR